LNERANDDFELLVQGLKDIAHSDGLPLFDRASLAVSEMSSWMSWQLNKEALPATITTQNYGPMLALAGEGGHLAPGGHTTDDSFADWHNIYFESDDSGSVGRGDAGGRSGGSGGHGGSGSTAPSDSRQAAEAVAQVGRWPQEHQSIGGVASAQGELSQAEADITDHANDGANDGANDDANDDAGVSRQRASSEGAPGDGHGDDEGGHFELVDTVIAGRWRQRRRAESGKAEIYFEAQN
jgi:hypothetical protein